MNALLEFYKNIGASLGIVFDDNGFASVVKGTDSTPITIENRRLVLPTPAHLKASNWEAVVAFHPLCESIVRGESEVFGYIRERVLRRLNAAVMVLVSELTKMAADADGMANLTDNQVQILSSFGKLDDRSVTDIGELIVKCAQKGNGSLLNIYVRRDDKVADKRYRRVAVTSLPLLDALDKTTVYGVQLRQGDRRFLRSLFTAILPHCDIDDQYSRGSNADVAPYFDVLIHAYKAVMDPLNSMIWTFRKPLGEWAGARAPTEWYDGYSDAVRESNLIPALPLNIGKGGESVATPAQPPGVGAAPTIQQGAPTGTVQHLLGAYPQPNTGYPGAPQTQQPQLTLAQILAGATAPAQYQQQAHGNVPVIPGLGMPQGGYPQHNPLSGFATLQGTRQQTTSLPPTTRVAF